MKELWVCNTCNRMLKNVDFLKAMSPFCADDELWGCPYCKQCDEGFKMVCDVDGCHNIASCGWPSSQGYRHTCHKHLQPLDPPRPPA